MRFRELTRDEFLETFKTQWEQGQHCTLVGTTGSGKTVLAQQLCSLRKWCVVIASKSKDKSLTEFPKDFHRIKKWPPEFHQHHVIFWQKPGELGDFNKQRVAIYQVLSDVYYRGGWTAYLDDIFYLSKTLRLEAVLQMMYTQYRSQGSLLGSIQRPAWSPLEVVNQATHVLIFGLKDHKDVERVAQEQGISIQELREALRELDEFEFVWVRTKHSPVIVRR